MDLARHDHNQEASKDEAGIITVSVPEKTEDVDYVEQNIRDRMSKSMLRMSRDASESNKGLNRLLQWVVVVATILSSTFLFSLDNTIVADVQPPIVEAFGEVEKLSCLWQGRTIYGIFSAKWLYCGSIIMFEVGSAICGAAPTMNAMIVGKGHCRVRSKSLTIEWSLRISKLNLQGRRDVHRLFNSSVSDHFDSGKTQLYGFHRHQ